MSFQQSTLSNSTIAMDDIPRYAVTHFYCGVTTDSQLTAMCHGKRFHVFLSCEELHEHGYTGPSPLEQHYLRLLHAVEHEDENEFNPEDGDPVEAMYDWVTTPFFSVFQELAPRASSTPPAQTMYDYFNPTTFFFKLKAVDGCLTPVRSPDDAEAVRHLTPRLELPKSLLSPSVPTIHPKLIKLAYDAESEGAQYPTKVFINGDEPYFFKPTSHGDSRAVEREIEILLRLQQLGLSARIRVPRLCGFVQYGDDNRVTGLLLTWIDVKDTLSGVRGNDYPLALRKRWFGEIEEMLQLLHESNIVWGDVKPDNVLVDSQRNAWMVDFGGSYTVGWVDEDKMDTIKGDMQGLARIREFLCLRQRCGFYWLSWL